VIVLEIQLEKGTILVDDDDWEYLNEFSWYISHTGYSYTGIWMKFKQTTKQVKMERFIMRVPKGFIIDHINGNRCDNRKENLRLVTKQENNINRCKRSGCPTTYKGLTWIAKERRWKVRVKLDGKEYYVGRFVNEIDAAHAYDFKALELFGEIARLNFPDFDYSDYEINRTTYHNQQSKNVNDPPKV
jgi:hypothetical protein